MALIEDTPCTVDVKTLTPCLFLTLEQRSQSDLLLSKSPEVLESIKCLAQERREAKARLADDRGERIEILSGHEGEPDLPKTFVDYEDNPPEFIMSRIDRLEAETKYVLQCASVIGRLFRYRLLGHLVRNERELDGFHIISPKITSLYIHIVCAKCLPDNLS